MGKCEEFLRFSNGEARVKRARATENSKTEGERERESDREK